MLANQAANKRRVQVGRQNRGDKRKRAKPEADHLLGIPGAETRGQYLTNLSEKRTVQHRHPRIQEPTDGLAPRIRNQLVLAPHQGAIVETTPQIE